MSTIDRETGWAAVATHGKSRPFIHASSVSDHRAGAQRYIGDAWARPDESWRQGWRRAYRAGWRAVRVTIEVR